MGSELVHQADSPSLPHLAFPRVPAFSPRDLTRCTSAGHSQLCVQGEQVEGFLCVCLLVEVRAPDPCEVAQFLSVGVSSKKLGLFPGSSRKLQPLR